MFTNKVTVALVLLAAAVLAGGSVYYFAGSDRKPVAEPTNGSQAESAGRAAVEEGFVGAARAAVKKGDGAGAASAPHGEMVPGANGREKEDYVNSVFRPLAASGPEVAMARVRALPDDESRDMAMLALLGEWTGSSVAELVQRGELGRFGVAGALALHLMREGKISPQQAASMANDFLSGGQRVGVLGRAAEQLAPTDPQAALAMGDGLADWEQVRFLSRFVAGWASASPEAARAWVAQVEDTRTRSMLMGRVLGEEVKVNPAGAAQTFLQTPLEDARVRQRTARQIASGWAGQDTLAAMQWADSLPDENERNAARQGISSVAPVGIGARISTGDDGVPVLRDFVPGSPAGSSGQLRSGDRVLAVADAGGSWVDSRNMPLQDVVGMIQGQPNTQVSLQVQAADGSPPRVVTLGRQQIIHRPGN